MHDAARVDRALNTNYGQISVSEKLQAVSPGSFSKKEKSWNADIQFSEQRSLADAKVLYIALLTSQSCTNCYKSDVMFI